MPVAVVTQKYRDKYKKLLAKAYNQVDTTSELGLKEIIKFLKELDKKVTYQMVKAKNYRAEHLRDLRKELKKHVDEFERRLLEVTGKAQKKTYKLGAKSVLQLPKSFQVKAVLPAVSEEALRIAQSFTADLVTGVTNKVRERINSEVSQVALGVKKPLDAIKALARIISPVRTKVGYVGTAYRAEMIVRTETNRAFSIGADERAKQVEKKSPGLKKWWLTARDERVRDSHYEAGIRYSEDKAIPVKKRFSVGRASLDYPSDPAGLPEEVINCRCRAIYVHPKWEEEAEEEEKKEIKKETKKKLKKIAKKEKKRKLTPKEYNEKQIAKLFSKLGLPPDTTFGGVKKEIINTIREEPDIFGFLRHHLVGSNPDSWGAMVSEIFPKIRERMEKNLSPESRRSLEGWKQEVDKPELLGSYRRYLDLTQLALRRKYPSGAMKLYRGLGLHSVKARQKITKNLDRPERFTYSPEAMVESWTTSYKRAKRFADEGFEGGVVLEMEVPIDYIGGSIISDPKSYAEMPEERESTVISKFTKAKAEYLEPVGMTAMDKPLFRVKMGLKGKKIKEAEEEIEFDFSDLTIQFPIDLKKAIAYREYLRKQGKLKDPDIRRAINQHIERLNKRLE